MTRSGRRPRGSARWLLAPLAVLLALGAMSGRADAHAELESTSPEAGSILTSSPSRILLTFTEPVDAIDDSIRLVSGAGVEIDLGDIDQSLGADTIATSAPELEDGTYVVAWRVISSDSHPISGAFTFSVGNQSATDEGLIDRVLAQDDTASPTTVWLGIGRWASFAGIGVLIGVLVTLARCAPEALQRRRTHWVLVGAAAAAVVGTALMIAAQGGVVTGSSLDPGAWQTVADTRSGRWWVVRLLAAVVALGLVFSGLHRRRRDDGTVGVVPGAVFLLGATGLLAVVAAGGHGVTGRIVAVGFLATWLHLAAMSIWVGGLVALCLLVGRERAREAALRFSPLAFWSVVVLALSGVLNAWRQSESFPALRDSDYGKWLLVKLVAVVGVVAIAGVSRSLVRSTPDTDESRRAIGRAVTLEVVGMVVVLAATAGLVNSPPPREDVPATVSVSQVQGERKAEIVLDPPVTGGTIMHVYVTSTTGALARPESIAVTASLPERGIERLELPLVQELPGHLSADGVVLPVAGRWTFVVEVRYDEFDQVRFELQADVR